MLKVERKICDLINNLSGTEPSLLSVSVENIVHSMKRCRDQLTSRWSCCLTPAHLVNIFPPMRWLLIRATRENSAAVVHCASRRRLCKTPVNYWYLNSSSTWTTCHRPFQRSDRVSFRGKRSEIDPGSKEEHIRSGIRSRCSRDRVCRLDSTTRSFLPRCDHLFDSCSLSINPPMLSFARTIIFRRQLAI